ncbi:hypothetical protein KIW84_022275 [Lathyrus oleraceus]|uniref:Uncharacterized protein n=1 Tax=Pisum sativum TaxID=3888 RepID=A0A9D5B9R4_PEA|nr:hypothetical protein KIW84_022275 [Pisum sativum]
MAPAPMPYYQYPYVAIAQYPSMPYHRSCSYSSSSTSVSSSSASISSSAASVPGSSTSNETIVPKGLSPIPKHYKPWYDENDNCAFHDNSEGHTTENCRVFKL